MSRLTEEHQATFTGYRRPDGQVGIRNHVVVMPTVICANQAVTAIAEGLPAVAIPHVYGCAFDGRENVGLEQTLIGIGRNPNVAAVLVISLGCETASLEKIVAGIAASGKPVEGLRIQEVGGTVRTIARGREIVARLAEEATAAPRADVRGWRVDAGGGVWRLGCLLRAFGQPGRGRRR